MKPSSVFINVGRGQVVVEDDLVKALKDKVIAGAVLDVFYEEPLPTENELGNLDNVYISPHCADDTPDDTVKTMEIFLDNLNRYVAKEPLQNIVNKEEGY